MSLGYAGHARLEAEDDEIAIYSYTGVFIYACSATSLRATS